VFVVAQTFKNFVYYRTNLKSGIWVTGRCLSHTSVKYKPLN